MDIVSIIYIVYIPEINNLNKRKKEIFTFFKRYWKQYNKRNKFKEIDFDSNWTVITYGTGLHACNNFDDIFIKCVISRIEEKNIGKVVRKIYTNTNSCLSIITDDDMKFKKISKDNW
jgi:hypothetical protein